MKSSAIDYLIEFVNAEKNDLWLKGIVASYLNSKGKISRDELQRLSEELLADVKQDSSLHISETTSDRLTSTKIQRLKHGYGVNALAKEQEIAFNNEVTVIYGLNGSGKSSYFRMLQGMIGNLSGSDIIPNIYMNNNQPVIGSLEYSVGAKANKVTWNNNGVISDLNTVKVFDSKCSQAFLGKRESDEQIINPYKLYAFSEIASYIDQVKEIASDLLKKKESKIVSPNAESFTPSIKSLLEKEVEENDKNVFISIAQSYNETKEQELSDTRSEIQSLTETNYEDKLKIEESNAERVKQVKRHIENDLISWVNNSSKYHDQWTIYSQYIEKSEQNRKTIKILDGLPGTDSNEWKVFIQRGLSISSQAEEIKGVCPFCHRTYDGRALEIVQAYTTFVNDETEEQLSQYELVLREIVNRARASKFVESDYQLDMIPEVQSSIAKLMQCVQKYTNLLVQMGDSLNDISPIDFDTTSVITEIDAYLKSTADRISQIKEDNSKKEEDLRLKREKVAVLISEKSIHDQIEIIGKFIDDRLEVNRKRMRINAASSNRITRISGIAHNELLTDQLMIRFGNYLDKFEIKDRELELSGRNSKGRQQTELIIKSQKNVAKILSEGEQKAVAIALFFAEISVSQNKSTVIMDDPVNSLDHRMIERFADILLQLENQVVVFTHNRMFLDSISGSDYGHLCKNFQLHGCSKPKGKHVFIYKIQSEGPNDAGVITSQNKDDAKGCLDAASTLLSQSPFSEDLKTCALLRNAIDHIIDEVVFNKQVPRKYSMKGCAQSINWDELKKMATDPSVIDELKNAFGRVSSGQLHYGQVSSINPPNKEELQKLHDKLISILN
ncbi:MAG: AAA family ATPase [Tissierellia bacterium]|nr:AAA family ATPase [Tissierellia bacterium]